MQINSIPAGGIASSVWTNATRNLTALSTNVINLLSQAKTTLAASASLDLRPATARARELWIAGIAGAAGAFNIQIWDGTNAGTISSFAASTGGGLLTYGNNTVGARINNADGTNAASYWYGGSEWIQ